MPASPDRAIGGASALDSFLSELRASHLGPSDVTVIGHSYGSLVVGEAAQNEHFAADNIVLVGSPGAGVEFASQLQVAPGHVLVGANGGDKVVIGSDIAGLPKDLPGLPRQGIFGTDPSDRSFGATRLPTGGSSAGATGSAPYLNHDYFHIGSQSLQNMAAIVAGHPGAIV